MIIQHMKGQNILSYFLRKNTASVLGENALSSKILKAKKEKNQIQQLYGILGEMSKSTFFVNSLKSAL